MTPDDPAEVKPGPGPVIPPEVGCESIWRYKPWWCQPWSILLTGVVLIAASWLCLQWWWLTVPVTLAVTVWWLLFLVLVPRAWREEQSSNKG